ncbi:hypothetical protein L0152_20350 [bacterium]|nr:hypothetical protein [bacterium]
MKIKDKDQKYLIKAIAKKIGADPNDVAYFLIEMGASWCIVAHKPIVEREGIFSKLDNETIKKLSYEIFLSWQAGKEANKQRP